MDKLKALEILGCKEKADLKEIKKAYAQKVKEFHPEEDPERFQEIKEAYETLKNAHLHTTKSVIFEDKETVENNNFDEYYEEKFENQIKIDYENVIQSAEKSEQDYQQALELFQSYLKIPNLSLNEYECLFRKSAYQEFLFSQRFMKDICEIISNQKIAVDVADLLMDKFHLNQPVTETEKKLQEVLIKNNKRDFHKFNLLFLPVSLLIIISGIFNYDIKEIILVEGFLFVQILLLFIFYYRYIQKHRYLNTLIYVIGLGLVSYGLIGTTIALIDEYMMEIYVDITVPVLLLWFSIFLILCLVTLINKIRHKL